MNWNHVLHIVRKDFRAQQFHLTLWGILLILYVAILGRWDLGQPAGASAVTIVAHLLPLVVIVYGLAIVVVLIHHDPVAGTSAFWLTRPVRGASLLVAKMIEAAAMVALWFFADFLVLAGNGVVGHAGYLAFDFATSFLPVMLVVFAIAALAPNTPRFFLTIALVVVGFFLVAMVLNMVTTWFVVSDAAADNSRTLGVRLSARVVGATIASLGACAILGWQFITRRTGVSIVAAMILATGTYVASASWSHDFFSRPRTALRVPLAQIEAVEVEIDSSDFRSGFATVSTGDGAIEYRTVSALTAIRGLPDGVFAEVGSARARVVTADGHEFLQQPDAGVGGVASGAGISAALDGAAIAGDDAERESWRAIVRTDKDEFEQFAHQPCTLESEIHLELYRYELLGELPLVVGAKGNYDGLQMQITDVVPRTDGQTTPIIDGSQPEAQSSSYECEVHFSEKYLTSRLKAVREGKYTPAQYSNVTYVLVNRQRKEAVLARGGGSSSFGGIRMMFRFSDRHLDFPPAFTGNGTQRFPRIDDAWLAGASLAILQRNSLGEITRTATIEDVVFEPKK